MGTEARKAARSPTITLVSDAHVARHYLEPAETSLADAGLQVRTVIVPPGEASKSVDQAARLWDAMLDAGMDRGSLVVGLGGGVVTDLAGFVASTYMRGIAWIAAGTSLLGMVDASVGGKTAVDHPACKNLIGAFHHPVLVLADVSTLATLPEAELRGGMAEVVKHGVIRDEDLVALCEREADAILARDEAVLEDVVARNVRLKAEVVEADEREGDLRRILNYGHTLGHALETHLGLAHGPAVALGMTAEARLARARGMADSETVARQTRLLERFGLPTRLDEPPDAEACLDLVRRDKKAEAGRRRFVLPTGVGTVEVVEDVRDDEVRKALASLATA